MSTDVSGPVRVRFAPAPTGHLHIGNFRTAIFNWLFARHYNGTFLVRVEDTDTERFKQEYIDSIHATLQWSGFMPDEPVVIQSSRIAEHEKVLVQLLEKKAIYRCYCTEQEVVERHQKRCGNDLYVKYDGYCRDNDIGDTKRSFVLRFALPRGVERFSFEDMIRGIVTFDMGQFDDFIIVRSDGRPVYNLVVVLDDAFMNVSHVIRGEDHIPNTPKQIMLFQACGYQVPQFAHLPLILGPSGDKLSKRDGAVAVVDYIKNGYLPEALINYLVRLGWSHGDQEIFTCEELIKHFSLDHVGRSGSIFDQEKLKWVNGVYLKKYSAEQLLDYALDYCEPELVDRLNAWNKDQIVLLISLYKERVHTVGELIDALVSLYSAPQHYELRDVEQWVTTDAVTYLRELQQTLEKLPAFSIDSLSTVLKEWCKDRGIKLVAIAQPLRIALVGKAASPGVFELLSVVGRQETISRIQLFLDHIDVK